LPTKKQEKLSRKKLPGIGIGGVPEAGGENGIRNRTINTINATVRLDENRKKSKK